MYSALCNSKIIIIMVFFVVTLHTRHYCGCSRRPAHHNHCHHRHPGGACEEKE